MAANLNSQTLIVGTTQTVEGSDYISLTVTRSGAAPFTLAAGDKIQVIVTPSGSTPPTLNDGEELASGTVPGATTWGVMLNATIVQTPPIAKAPTILAIGPEEGGPSVIVNILGSDLPILANAEVKIGGVVCTAVDTDQWSSIQIFVECPAGLLAGSHAVTVKDTDSGLTSNADQLFELLAPTILVDGGISPDSERVSAEISIIGENFSENISDNEVKFTGSVFVTTIVSAAQDELVVVVPPDAQTGPIIVKVSPAYLVNNQVTSVESFTRNNHTIASYTPSSAAVGAIIRINGTNFTDFAADQTVTFYNNQAADPLSLVVIDETAIEIRVPKTCATGVIKVDIGGVVVTGPSFTRNNHTVTSYTPSHAQVGATVVINGTNFSLLGTDHDVRFNGTLVTAPIVVIDNTKIQVVVPGGATTGTIRVDIGSVQITGPSFTVDP